MDRSPGFGSTACNFCPIKDKYIYDKNIYKPDRLGLFDISDFKTTKPKGKKAINGHIYFNHNKYQGKIDNRGEN